MEHDRPNLTNGEKQQEAIAYILAKLYEKEDCLLQDTSETPLTEEENTRLDALMEQALEHITTMRQYDYEELLASMVAAYFVPGYEEIVFNLEDKNRLSLIRFIVLINNKMKNAGRVMPLFNISNQTIDAKGGFLLKSGTDCIDCTIETLLAEKKRPLAPVLLNLITD